MNTDVLTWTINWTKANSLRVWFADQIESTNTVAKNDDDSEILPRLLDPQFTYPQPQISAPTLYLTRRQSAGRGRGAHTWTTPEGASLLSSWSFAVSAVPQPIFSALVGLALFETCREIWPNLKFNLKAPNDLFIADKKTAGILIETVDQGASIRTVIGLGFNVVGRPEDVPTATCLADHGARVDETSWGAFLSAWLKNLRVALLEGFSGRLDSAAASRLCSALNLHPLLKEPILRVDELGQLHSASRIIHWHEL